MSKEKKYYVYMYFDKMTSTPFYIGKGCGRRYELSNHIRKTPTFLSNKINKLGKENIDIRFIYRTNNEQKAYDKEMYWVSKIGRRKTGIGSLCNLTDGGDIGPTGLIHSRKTKKIMARKHIGLHSGEKHPQAKLTEQQVLEIRSKYQFDKEGKFLGLNFLNLEGRVVTLPIGKIRTFTGF